MENKRMEKLIAFMKYDWDNDQTWNKFLEHKKDEDTEKELLKRTYY